MGKQLLQRLKELLVLDWRERQTSRARVEDAINEALDGGLPPARGEKRDGAITNPNVDDLKVVRAI